MQENELAHHQSAIGDFLQRPDQRVRRENHEEEDRRRNSTSRST